ncbi:hypothetical protein COCNU_scaffold002089G000040 [Cocos nucifera]|nr:hypothetical protein [Cocos nucifera]
MVAPVKGRLSTLVHDGCVWTVPLVCTFRLLVKNAASLLDKGDPVKLDVEAMLNDLIRSFSLLGSVIDSSNFEFTTDSISSDKGKDQYKIPTDGIDQSKMGIRFAYLSKLNIGKPERRQQMIWPVTVKMEDGKGEGDRGFVHEVGKEDGANPELWSFSNQSPSLMSAATLIKDFAVIAFYWCSADLIASCIRAAFICKRLGKSTSKTLHSFRQLRRGGKLVYREGTDLHQEKPPALFGLKGVGCSFNPGIKLQGSDS